MKKNLSQKLIENHLVSGKAQAGEEVGISIDQALCQDATGTLVMLELEQMELERVKTHNSSIYVDHNLLQTDNKNPDDHLFLKSAAARFGLHFSRPGNGISHVVHMSRLGVPGETLLGSDSHTCAAGSLGMLAIGSGGLDIAMAMAGEPYYIKMPEIWGVELAGDLPDWVSAKNVILEMLRRHGVRGGVNRIIEYYGPGVKNLSAMDRHVIANMGAELGATTSVFPSDEITKDFLKRNKREADWNEQKADEGCDYDQYEKIDMSQLEPLIAKPSSPGNVVPLSEVEGEKIYQAYIGSSANPGFRDFAISGEIVRGKRVPSDVSFDVNISSREIMENLAEQNYLQPLLVAGGRLHQIGCNGCIGMGQAPASHQNSLRTVPRNFPGRSGTKEDRVFLTSPEVAAASALTGKITDPRNLSIPYPKIKEPEEWKVIEGLYDEPLPLEEARKQELVKGPNIKSLPKPDPISETIEVPIGLKVGDDISTDEILPAGSEVLPFRSNIEKISTYVYYQHAPRYQEFVQKKKGLHAIIAGENYGQGSSREHAALAPFHLGLRVVVAKGFARIHWQNLILFGVLPLEFSDSKDYEPIEEGSSIQIDSLWKQIENGNIVKVRMGGKVIETKHSLSVRQIDVLKAGGVIPWFKIKN